MYTLTAYLVQRNTNAKLFCGVRGMYLSFRYVFNDFALTNMNTILSLMSKILSYLN